MELEVEIHDDVFLPVYRPLLADSGEYDIDFKYGGRDSGKSRDTAQALILECLQQPYFRCLLIRDVKDTVKDSQWQLLKDVVDEWNLGHLFTFTSSPLAIKCINGNTFHARGCDNIGKIKSFSNPSHCWIEEGNQISEDAFNVILTSLRYNKGKVKTYFTFNPECTGNYKNFWLYKNWFAHTDDLSFVHKQIFEVDGKEVHFNYRVTHSTYKDNPYCSDERKALYESYAKKGGYYYNVYTLGRWGYKKTGGEFWKQFSEEQHVKAIDIKPLPIGLVIDSNVTPYVTVAAWQTDWTNKELLQIHEIPCYPKNNNAPRAARKVAEWLDKIGYQDVVQVYGDPAANARSTIDENNSSFFSKFIKSLEECGYKVSNKVAKSAPEVALSGAFIDEIYESELNGWKIIINKTCRVSIEDYTMVKEAADGTMMKKRIKDKETEQTYEEYGHFSDAKRYYITTMLKAEFEKYGAKKKRLKIYSID